MEKQGRVSNLDYLVELSKGNDQFVKDMVRIFLEENPAEISMLEKGLEQSDFDLVRSSAHKLRSTAPFVGVDRVIEDEICELEKLAGEQSAARRKADTRSAERTVSQKMNELLSKIKSVFSRACLELRNYAL